MNIGLIGVGEVGSAYARALGADGLALCDRLPDGRPAGTATALGLDLRASAAASAWPGKRSAISTGVCARGYSAATAIASASARIIRSSA